MLHGPRLRVFLRAVGVEEKENSRAPVVERRSIDPLVLVDWPKIPIAFHHRIMRSAEERPDPAGRFSFSAIEYDQRPRRRPFGIFFLTIDGVRDSQRP